jgi:hypothetical protein
VVVVVGALVVDHPHRLHHPHRPHYPHHYHWWCKAGRELLVVPVSAAQRLSPLPASYLPRVVARPLCRFDGTAAEGRFDAKASFVNVAV